MHCTSSRTKHCREMAHTGDKRATAAAQAGNAASLGADHETNVIALIQCEPALEAQVRSMLRHAVMCLICSFVRVSQALLRMRNMPYRVVNTGHSWFMSTGTLPQLRQGCDLAGAARIGYKIARTTSDGSGASLADSMLGASAKLGDLTRSLDAELESKHLSQIVAFSALVERVLGDVLVRAFSRSEATLDANFHLLLCAHCSFSAVTHWTKYMSQVLNQRCCGKLPSPCPTPSRGRGDGRCWPTWLLWA